MPEADDRRPAMRQLGDDDMEFVQRFVLSSGSLKDLAAEYGVSYPTIRARLDKLLERLKSLVAGQPRDPMAELLADLVGRGELSAGSARSILDMHRKRLKKREESS